MTGSFTTTNAYASSSTATYIPRTTASLESSSTARQQLKQKLIVRDHALAPAHRDKLHSHERPSLSSPSSRAKSVSAPTSGTPSAFGPGVLHDEDETDDDEDAVRGAAEQDSVVEDLCLSCRGACRCGGATGAGLPPRLEVHLVAVPPVAQSKTRSAHLPASHVPPKYTQRSLSPQSLLVLDDDDDDEPEFRPAKRSRPSPKNRPATRRAIGASTSEVIGTPKKPRTRASRAAVQDATFPSVSASTRKDPVVIKATSVSPRKGAPRPLPTPSRSSLRQILAQSVRDVSESRGSSPALSVQEGKKRSSESDDDLSNLDIDSEGEEEIERSEERQLREDFERDGFSGLGTGVESSDEDDLSDLSEVDRAEGWEERARGREEDRRRTTKGEYSTVEKNRHAHREASFGFDESMEFDEDDFAPIRPVNTDDIPPTGGRGVVTWSDYDSVDNSDAEDEGGEFEDELEELLALSEAVVGPVREDEYELGEMWFEEISNEGDDESGSGDSEGGDGDTTVIVEGWGKSSCGSGSDSSDSDDTEGYEYFDEEDGGDTTDSLDSDDHIGLIRFGIEVDSDSTAAGYSSDNGLESIYYPSGFTSLADVQAPTTADLASLPQYLFSGPVHDDLPVSVDKSNGMPPPESHSSDPALLEVVPRSQLKGKGRSHQSENLDESLLESGGRPSMGSFMPKESGRGSELSVVIDGSDAVAPSPFSKVKKGKKRSRDLLEGATPSRRSRADSKVSTASGRSVTDGSASGEVAELFSPVLASQTMDLDLNDLLNASVLGRGAASHLSSDEADSDHERDPTKTNTVTRNGMLDLTRWNRVPIGAFRSSTMSNFSPTQHFLTATVEEKVAGYNSGRRPSAGTLYLPVVGRSSRGGSSLSHTLSPHPSSSSATTTKRAIERMLHSPLLRPVRDPAESNSPKSRKVKRKERRLSSSHLSSPAVTIAAAASRLLLPTSSPTRIDTGNPATLAFLNAIPRYGLNSPQFRAGTTLLSSIPPLFLE